MAGNFCKLVMVSSENNNKFYTMTWDGISSTMDCEYGRIELTSTKIKKPYSDWDKVKKEKIKKGYKDVTHTVSETILEKSSANSSDKNTLAKIENNKVDYFINLMQKYTKNLVQQTYTVKAKSVTKAQLDDAQGFINKLSSVDKSDEKAVNKILLDLYTVIPRFMTKVPNYLLPNIDLDKTFQQEQDNLDAMASQVSIAKEEITEVVEKQNTLLDLLGVKMDVVTGFPTEIAYILNQINKTGRIVESIYSVDKQKENDILKNRVDNAVNKKTQHLIHGTRCTSIIPIMEQGLKIRPTGNFVSSGKAFGNANYFANEAVKSLGYVGHDTDKIFLIYEVHTGNSYEHTGRNPHGGYWFDNLMKDKKYDSVHALKGNNSSMGWGGLINDEIMVYTEQQNALRYIIHMK